MADGPVAPYQFDTAGMFRRAGGAGMASDMRELLLKYVGCAPELSAVQMWKQRGTIPSAWQASVLYSLMREGNRVVEMMSRHV